MSATSTTKQGNVTSAISLAHHLRQNWQIWCFALIIAGVNWPLLLGRVQVHLLFLPDAVEAGQWWRLITFPLVHLSWYHLLLDAGGFLLVYQGLEEKRFSMKSVYIIGAGVGSLWLCLATSPGIDLRGLCGLSGLAHGLMAVSALEMLRYPDQRTWGWRLLATVVIKSAYELWRGKVLFDFLHMGLCGHPIAASHAGGVVGAILVFAGVQGGRLFLHRVVLKSSIPA